MDTFPAFLRKAQPFFGEWMLDGMIGSGSNGTVVRIFRGRGNKKEYAALKWVAIPQDNNANAGEINASSREELAASYKDLLDRLMREVEAMKALKGHPNIAQLEDYQVIPRKTLGYDILIRMEP